MALKKLLEMLGKSGGEDIFAKLFGGGDMPPIHVDTPGFGSATDRAALDAAHAAREGQREAELFAPNARTRSPEGRYYGSPDIQNPQQLGRMRRKYMDKMEKGMPGFEWYPDSSLWIDSVAPNPISGERMADIGSVTSASTGLDTNLGFTLKALLQDATDQPIDTGRFPTTMGPPIKDILHNDPSYLGPKREPFAMGLMSELDDIPRVADKSVHDIRDARNWGYTDKDGNPWSAGMNPAQHRFMDENMDWVIKQANKEGLGGKTNWNHLNAQSNTWIVNKAEQEGISIEEAAKSFAELAEKYKVNLPHEQIPGDITGHLEGLADLPYNVREGYTYDPRATWMTERGNDFLVGTAGMPSAPTRKTVGSWLNDSGVVETNPSELASAFLPWSQRKNAKDVGIAGEFYTPEAGEDLLGSINAVRGYVDAQAGVGYNRKHPKGKAGLSTGVEFPGVVGTEDIMSDLSSVAKDKGMFTLDTGGDIRMITDPFGDHADRTGGDILNDLKKGAFQEAEDIVGVPGQRMFSEGDMFYYGDNFSQAEMGKGAATRQMFEQLDKTPKFEARLNASPEFKRKVLAKLDQDAAYAEKLGLPVREDIMNARRILSTGNLKALRKALDKGEFLPSVLAGIVPIMGAYSDDGDLD